VWSTLQRIELAGVKLSDTTRASLGATRNVVAMPPALPHVLHNVVLIVEATRTTTRCWRSRFGPRRTELYALRRGRHAEPARAGASLRPSGQHVRRAGGITQDILAAGVASAYTERLAGVRDARRPLGFASEDPRMRRGWEPCFTNLRGTT